MQSPSPPQSSLERGTKLFVNEVNHIGTYFHVKNVKKGKVGTIILFGNPPPPQLRGEAWETMLDPSRQVQEEKRGEACWMYLKKKVYLAN